MTKLAPEWVRTSDPVIRSPARYRWTTAPAFRFCWMRSSELGDLYFSSVASVRFAVGVHEVPPHRCTFAVTYKPCSMQRWSEV